MLAAAAYVSASYFLADIYLRGAYYEVVACAFMPWIMWLCCSLFRRTPSSGLTLPFLAGCVSWLLLLCGHPQIAVFFIPAGFAYAIYLYCRTKDGKGLALCCLAFACGLLLSAPYTYVAFREMGYVRMELFYVNLESYYHNYISLKTLLFEKWPSEYMGYTGAVDYLGRPIRCEMRGLNLWALAVLVLAPILWFRGKSGAGDESRSSSMFFYFWTIAAVAAALPLSHGFWELVTFAHTFNFPWRSLSVASLCISILCGLVAEEFIEAGRWRSGLKTSVVALLILLITVPAFRHAGGWCAEDKLVGIGGPTREIIAYQSGIPQEFYTPKWVRNYAAAPARSPVEVREGDAKAVVTGRGAVKWSLDVASATGARLVLSHYYYPGWTLYVPGGRKIPAEPDENGLMSYAVPAGRYSAEARFALTADRILAYAMAVSGLAAMAVVSFLIAARGKDER